MMPITYLDYRDYVYRLERVHGRAAWYRYYGRSLMTIDGKSNAGLLATRRALRGPLRELRVAYRYW